MMWETIMGATGSGAVWGGGVVGALAIIIVAFRKRRDVDYEEMERRIAALEARVTGLEGELHDTRETLVRRDRQLFTLRRTLAQNGIADPTRTPLTGS